VAIDNATGEVRAMVGGDDYTASPFNIATQGQRQPGSAFKPFILAEALRQGISPDSQWSSRKREICLQTKGGRCVDAFKVNNYEDAYAGTRTLRTATTFSDNAVYAEVGLKVRTKRVARLARRMGIRTPVSSNAAMTLGGLRRGVTPLDMAHAYQTFASGGELVYGTLSPGADSRRKIPVPGPVAIREIRRNGDPVELPDGRKAKNRKRTRRVMSQGVAREVEEILGTVVTQGTAARAALTDEFAAGKTGTTENYGDAWFVGWTKAYTVAVWVGYPDRLKYMKTEFRGDPVAGGTYPAGIWKSFVEQALKLRPGSRSKKKPEAAPPVLEAGGAPAPGAPQPSAPAPAPGGTAAGGGQSASGGGGTGGAQGAGEGAPQPEAIPQSPPVQDAPAQDPAAAAPPAPPPAGEPGGTAPPPG
jgi:penicillin-binding protein 1A